MQKEDITIGIYSQNNQSELGLIEGFKQIGLNTLSIDECNQKGITPNLTIGFDTVGLNFWQKFLSKGITHINWATDSVFAQNYEVIKQFSTFKNFIFLHSTNADTAPIGQYLPSLTHGYLPLAVNTDYWAPSNIVKDIDFTVLGSIIDAQKAIEELEATMPELVFKLMMEVVNLVLLNPSLTLTDICSMFKSQMDFEFTDEQMILFMTKLSDIITTKLFERVLSKLQGTKLTLAGNENWKLHESKDFSYIKADTEDETRDIIQRSKIVLTVQPFSQAGGINSTLLKAAACETLVFTPFSHSLKNEFDDTLVYFNPVTCDDIRANLDKFLQNDNSRKETASQARLLVSERHSFTNRAKAIFDIIAVK